MRKWTLLTTWLLSMGCWKTPDWEGNYAVTPSWSANLPFLTLRYEGGLSVEFSSVEVRCTSNLYTDTANHAITIYSFNDTCRLKITMQADSLQVGTYSLAPANGEVTVVKYNRSTIGTLSQNSSFWLTIRDVSHTTLSGSYQGYLYNPLNGSMKEIAGSFNKLAIYD